MITQARDAVVDYCWSTAKRKIDLFSAQSHKPRLDVWTYVKIFPSTVWLTGICSIFVSAICFSVASPIAMSQSMTLMARLSLQMGYKVPSIRFASKALLIVAALSLKLLFIYYTCNLKAIMISGPPDIGIKSFEDVERQGYKVLTLPFGSKPYDLIANAPEGSAKQMIHKRNLHEVVDGGSITESNKKIIQRVKEDPKMLTFGGVLTGGTMDKNLFVLNVDDAVTYFNALALQKDSEFTTLFSHCILIMFENGVIKRIRNQWYGKHNQNYEMKEAVQLGYEHVLFLYSWLASGFAISVFIMLAELTCKRLAKTRQMKVTIPEIVSTNDKEINNIGQLLNEHELLIEKVKRLEARNKTLGQERDSLTEQLELYLPKVRV